MIDKNDRLKVPKRLYIMDYQLEPCKIDGISDARLNAFPFNTTNGKLVEYLCLDTLWHPASEEPKKGCVFLYKTISNGYGLNQIIDGNEWKYIIKYQKATQWFYVDDLFPKKGGKQ